jgi:hypothetical protein
LSKNGPNVSIVSSISTFRSRGWYGRMFTECLSGRGMG